MSVKRMQFLNHYPSYTGDPRGSIYYGEAPQPDTSAVVQLTDWRAGLVAGPGQKLQVVDVPDTLVNVTSPADLETQVKAVLAKSK